MEYVTRKEWEYYRRQATELPQLAAQCENPEAAQMLREAAEYFLRRFQSCSPLREYPAIPKQSVFGDPD
jgi:hypothetical protein